MADRADDTDTGIHSIDQLPEHGLVLEADILNTARGQRRVVPCANSTWKRRQREGKAPPSIEWFGRKAQRVEHVRAIAQGRDWRSVTLPKDVVEWV